MKALIATLSLLAAEPSVELAPIDTLHIDGVEVTASLKSDENFRTPISSTQLSMYRLEERGVGSIKELSTIAPNFYQADYGSSITSSIYVRGFGSRIDQPVVGVVIDDVAMMNKNVYDFDFFDIRRVEVLRGPQGTLYGRNTSGGVMNITTLSPFVWQGLRGMAEYSTVSSARAALSYYARPRKEFGYSVAASFSHDGGHFLNSYTGEMCDRGNQAALRMRVQWVRRHCSMDNTLTVGFTDEGGYAYRHYDAATEKYAPIAYNDPSGYERLTVSDGFVAKYEGRRVRVSSVTSYQFLGDRMTLDQDFTPRSMFTMQQRQLEHAITEDIVVRNAKSSRRWQWLSGLFAFAKWLDISSPVTFKQDGINDLILGNINKGIETVFPDGAMTFGVDNFVIASDFRIPTYGAALYHQSSWQWGRWHLTAGLRLDWEYASMRYNSHATIPFNFNITMGEGNYISHYTEFKGREKQHFFEVLPKLSVEYRMDVGELYATITRGYKAGGFNTQIFSDILQVKMMNSMMERLGVYLDSATTTNYDSASATRYLPETSWNFEIGAHIHPVEGLRLDGSLFWIECFDQQVTVLPKGNSTGRMMSNAARARSLGVELSAEYRYRGLNVVADYGFTDARFRDYNDGVMSYADCYLPYAPQNTASVMVGHTWLLDGALRAITLSADWRGVGRIYWNESNTLSQPFYSLLGAQLQLRMERITISLWGRNLTNTRYDVFYFKSVGEEFFAQGKPWQCGVKLNINI